MSLPAVFRTSNSIFEPEAVEVVQHEWVYSVEKGGVQDNELVRVFRRTFPTASLYPLIDWHRKHKSARLDGKDIYLCSNAQLHHGCFRIAIHGPAPAENWLETGPDQWVILHDNQFYFFDRTQLANSNHPVQECAFRSSAQYMLIPQSSPACVCVRNAVI